MGTDGASAHQQLAADSPQLGSREKASASPKAVRQTLFLVLAAVAAIVLIVSVGMLIRQRCRGTKPRRHSRRNSSSYRDASDSDDDTPRKRKSPSKKSLQRSARSTREYSRVNS